MTATVTRPRDLLAVAEQRRAVLALAQAANEHTASDRFLAAAAELIVGHPVAQILMTELAEAVHWQTAISGGEDPRHYTDAWSYSWDRAYDDAIDRLDAIVDRCLAAIVGGGS